MMKLADVKSAVLARLYEVYQAHGTRMGIDSESLEKALEVHRGTVETIVRDFKARGIVDYQGTLGGARAIRLTVRGIEAFENPRSEIASYVQNIQHVTINAQQMQNTQLGNNNTINATYTTVLQQLAKEIEASDVEPAKKAEWLKTVDEIMAHPLTQTALMLVGTGVLQQPR
jgi:hypothetical protein